MALVHPSRKDEASQAARDILNPQFHQLHLKVEDYLKFRPDNPIKLDKDSQICRAALNGHCPLGPKDCPLRHTEPSPANFQPQKEQRGMSTVSVYMFSFQHYYCAMNRLPISLFFRSANTGSAAYARNLMLANSYTSTTFGECRNAGGMRRMVSVRRAKSAYMLTPREVK